MRDSDGNLVIYPKQPDVAYCVASTTAPRRLRTRRSLAIAWFAVALLTCASILLWVLGVAARVGRLEERVLRLEERESGVSEQRVSDLERATYQLQQVAVENLEHQKAAQERRNAIYAKVLPGLSGN